MAVACQRELGLEFGLVELLFDLEVEGVARQERRRRQPVQRGGGRHQHHVGPRFTILLADAPQRGQPFADQILVWREGVVGQRLPVREQRAAQCGREERHFLDEALRIGGVGRDDGGGVAGGLVAFGQAGQQQGIGAAHGAGQGETFSGGEFGQFHADGGVWARRIPWGAKRARAGWGATGDFRMSAT